MIGMRLSPEPVLEFEVSTGLPSSDPGPAPSGTTDYNDLENKPSINGIPLEGDKSLEDLGIKGTASYNDLEDKPTLNGIPLEGDMSPEDLGINGVSSYSQLDGKPAVNGVTLEGELTFEDLGLVEMDNAELLELFNSIIS